MTKTPSEDMELPRGTISGENEAITDPLAVVSHDLSQFTETKATVDGVWDCQAMGSQPVLVIANSEEEAIGMLHIWYGKEVQYKIAASTRHPMLGEDVIIKCVKSDNLTLRPWKGHNFERSVP